MAEKSLVEQALLEAKTIEESVKRSAKEILPSVLKREINDLVKESINEVDEIDLDSDTLDITDDEMDMDMMGPMGGMDMDTDSIELDLTASSDDEVMKVFKKMGPEDEIEVVKTGDGVTLTDGNEEYEIKNVSEGKKNEPIYEIELEDEMTEEWGSKEDEYKRTDGHKTGDVKHRYKDYEMNEEDEQMYEIELDDEVMEEDELEEQKARSHAKGQRASSGERKGSPKPSAIPNKSLYKKNIKESRKPQRTISPRVIKENKALRGTLAKYGDEVKTLKGKNEEYRKALSLFREKLNEVAVFNSNLAYTTKLFTDHSTTKKEKLNILSRFDEVNSLKESKSLYKQINSEVGTGKAPTRLKEAISRKGGTKVITESNNSANNSTIRENKVYQDPQMKRMMDLMTKIK